MKIQPLISVIIPVYNVEQYLEQCMTSVLCQTYTHMEILLIDDGSSDNSGRLCDEYAVQDKRVRVLHRENGGLMSAWMAGVEMAAGVATCYRGQQANSCICIPWKNSSGHTS